MTKAATRAEKRRLEQLLTEAKRRVEAMTPGEREAMHKAQRESWVRGQIGWPKPNFKFVGGVKVYASYADYCND